jgi:aminomethyltransferase
MNQSAADQLKTTPLNARHHGHGARMVPFAGWEMPVEYSGISHEHMAVRTRAGLFDVSHMGEIEVVGNDALAVLQQVVDDILVYRVADDHFMLVVNASNIDRDYRWIAERVPVTGDAVAVDSSSTYALLALQGPAARDVLQQTTNVDLKAIRRYWFTHGEVAGVRTTIARTGYTGEDGFEVFVPADAAERVWDAILQAGRPADVVPVGLGARDTLRLEAGMRLYGNDIDETTSVLEADLEWIVGWDKPGFPGRDALRQQKIDGVQRKLVGFEMVDRGIARHGYPTYASSGTGVVTSGTQTPFLGKAVGLAYLPVDATLPGTVFEVDIRGRRTRARVVPLPFYKRPRS